MLTHDNFKQRSVYRKTENRSIDRSVFGRQPRVIKPDRTLTYSENGKDDRLQQQADCSCKV